MNRYSYKNLNVYQDAKAFVVAVYKLLNVFPDCEKFALCNQIRRAAISVTSNIAEGVSRISNKEKIPREISLAFTPYTLHYTPKK